MKYIRSVSSRAGRILSDIYATLVYNRQIPLVYFNEISNVGDMLSPYIVEHVTGKTTRLVKTSCFKRLFGVGSIVGSATYNTYIWGSGSIDGLPPKAMIDSKKVFAVRGENTLKMLRSLYSIESNVALGDPALLMPQFYNPLIKKKFNFAFVPHYVDYAKTKELVAHSNQYIAIIDVRQPPENFINELLQCKYVISSSLHGLILADAYKIPNLWVTVSDSIVGGSWKFFDYYSTTDNKNITPEKIKCEADLSRVLENKSSLFRVSTFQYDLQRLIDSFPRHAF